MAKILECDYFWINFALIVFMLQFNKAQDPSPTREEMIKYYNLLEGGGEFLTLKDNTLRMPQPQIFVQILTNGSVELTRWPKGPVFMENKEMRDECNFDQAFMITNNAKQWYLCEDGGRIVLKMHNETDDQSCLWKYGETGSFVPCSNPTVQPNFGNATALFQSVAMHVSTRIEKSSPGHPFCRQAIQDVRIAASNNIKRARLLAADIRKSVNATLSSTSNSNTSIEDFMEDIFKLSHYRHQIKCREWELEGLASSTSLVFIGMNGHFYNISTPKEKLSVKLSIEETIAQLRLGEMPLLSNLIDQVVDFNKFIFSGSHTVADLLSYLGIEPEFAEFINSEFHFISRYHVNQHKPLSINKAAFLDLEKMVVQREKGGPNLECLEEIYHQLPGRNDSDTILQMNQ